MMRKSVVPFILFLTASSLSGCYLSLCDPSSLYYDEEACYLALTGGLLGYLTQAAYGEQRPLPPPEATGGCTSLRCQGGPCRMALDNGNFEQTFGLGFVHFNGAATHTDNACLADVGAAFEREGAHLYQWIVLEDVLTPEERADVTRLRVRARVWLNTTSLIRGEGRLRLRAVTGPSQSVTLLTREASLTTDDDTSTWESVDLAMALPSDTDHLFFEVESLSDLLHADYAQVAIDHGNRAPVAYGRTATIAEDTPWGFFPNAMDPDGSLNPLSLQTSTPQYGTLIDQIYTPAPEFAGTDTFTYTIADDQGYFSNEATVTLHITPINDVPIAADDVYDVPDGGLLLVPTPLGVLANDNDAEADTLTAVLVDDVQNGTLSLDADGGFAYTPGAGSSGTDTFTYRATDGRDTSAVATVLLNRQAADYDLAIEKTVTPTTAQQGQEIAFTVVVTNNGPGDAAGIRVQDQMTWYTFEFDYARTTQGSFTFDVSTASGRWNVGALAAGASATLTIVGPVGADMTNTATIANGLGSGDDAGNNEAAASITVP